MFENLLSYMFKPKFLQKVLGRGMRRMLYEMQIMFFNHLSH